jgi:hypothetical protein
MLGHSDVQLCLDVYDHLSTEDLRRALVPYGTQATA